MANPIKREKARIRTQRKEGFTRDEQYAFWDVERGRLEAGELSLNELYLTPRVYNGLKRFGVQTVIGLEEVMERGWKPRTLGSVLMKDAQSSLLAYRQDHPRAETSPEQLNH